MTAKDEPQEPKLAAWAWPNRGPALADKAAALGRSAVLSLVGTAVGACGAQVLLVKGAGLSHLYPAPWLRPMADLDLLVHPHDLERVASALTAHGFTRHASDRPLTETLLEVGFDAPHPHNTLVELHTSMDKVVQRPVDVDAVHRRSTASRWPGLLHPSLEDQLLFVTLHLASDEFRHASGMVDLEVLLGAGADLQVVASRAREWQAATALYLALRTFEHLLKRPAIPAGVIEQIRPSRPRSKLLQTHYEIGHWPVPKRPTELGWSWLYGQAVLQDDLVEFMRKLSAYALMRLREHLSAHGEVEPRSGDR